MHALATREAQQLAAQRSPGLGEWEDMLKRVTLQRDEAQGAFKVLASRFSNALMAGSMKSSALHTATFLKGGSHMLVCGCMQDCQAKLALRDMEVLQLQQQLATAQQQRGAAGMPSALDWTTLDSDSAASLPHLAQAPINGAVQAAEAAAQQQALEAAQAQNVQLQAALHALAMEMQQLQQAQLQPPPQLPQQPLQDATNAQQEAGQAELRRQVR